MAYLRSAWYVAALSSEIETGKIVSRTLIDIPMIIVRDRSGTPAVLEDRCPHRFAPLSLGAMCDDSIECGYHGMRFAFDGRCVENPTQPDERLPDRARVKTYPAIERYGFIWFWAGEGDPDPELMPDFPQYESEDYGFDTAYKFIAGNYQLLIDNLLDLSHAPWVHKGLLGDKNTMANWDFSWDQGPRHIIDRRSFPNRPAVPAWAKAYGDAFGSFDGAMDHWQETYWYAPANMLLDAGLVMPGAARGTGIDIIGLNLMTPETQTTTHYFYGMAHQYRHEERWVTDFWMNAVFHAFEDDRLMIEAVQRNMGSETDVVTLRPHINKADQTALMARRHLAKLIHEENKGLPAKS
ncbi:MAG: aromatic ring-hydroxylating dioxygenase subunit alpha [Sphingopyxis sp.]|nr:aromatic ring-hydroxylating dioxygenase subunit alpha [Sphingopyxis sp.]